ncbi:cobalamin B12-binding domain-containing protein [Baekduia sp. Peel2402]|uniref:cobalamin B12-binding domain-containing protein n=1 Tax=Baekduia sp. Peel2402 TaxID=3458296 RepID=UPI00403E99E9
MRPIRFQDVLLDEVEARIGTDGDLSHFVNVAIDRALHGDLARTLRAVPEPTGSDELRAASDDYRTALLARDERRAREIVEDLAGRGARIVDIYTVVLAPALQEIGDLWSLEKVTVADEHYASETTAQLMGVLAPDRRRAPTRGRLAVVAATPDELHALGPRMLSDLLERAGWEVIALGAAAPADALAQLVADECPDVVALSTATVGRLPGAEEAVGLLHRVRPRPLIALGGALYRGPVVELAHAWGADVVTSDLDALLEELGRRFPPTG